MFCQPAVMCLDSLFRSRAPRPALHAQTPWVCQRERTLTVWRRAAAGRMLLWLAVSPPPLECERTTLSNIRKASYWASTPWSPVASTWPGLPTTSSWSVTTSIREVSDRALFFFWVVLVRLIVNRRWWKGGGDGTGQAGTKPNVLSPGPPRGTTTPISTADIRGLVGQE